MLQVCHCLQDMERSDLVFGPYQMERFVPSVYGVETAQLASQPAFGTVVMETSIQREIYSVLFLDSCGQGRELCVMYVSIQASESP